MSSVNPSEAALLRMRSLKLEALEKGDLTDFVFLVGSDKSKAVLVHCFKADLLLASEYFRGLVRSGQPCPVHIKQIQPHVFKMLIRFISVHHLEKVSVDDYVSLALAADHFLMEPLRELCCSKIKKLVTVENVWLILDSTSHIPKLAAALLSSCAKVLSSETTKCLEDPSFLEVTEDSLLFFLQMNTLNIKSELDLLNACLKLAYSWPEKDGYELMRAALPHLRLLTLPTDQISILGKYLTAEEKAFLAQRVVFKQENASGTVRPSLNTNPTPRMKAASCDTNTLELIPEHLIITDHIKMIEKCLSLRDPQVFYLHIFSCQDFCLKSFEILTRANNYPDFRKTVVNNTIRFEPVNLDYEEDLDVQVHGFGKGGTEKLLFEGKITGKKRYNSWFSFQFDKDIFIPKGIKCTVAVTIAKAANYQSFSNKEIQDCIKSATCSITDIVYDKHNTTVEGSPRYHIFKSVTLIPC